MDLARLLPRPGMAVFHLECSVYRRCASGLSIAAEKIDASTDAQAAEAAEIRFEHLRAGRAGCATLWDDGGKIVWSTRRLLSVGRATDSHGADTAR